MGASLGSVLVNIIMAECEKVIADNLVKEETIKFYVPYVDDTFLLVKRQDIDKALKEFNGLDKNLKFIVDRFENGTPHFLDLEICPKIFQKNTHTGEYINMDSFTLWKSRTALTNHLLIEQRK